MATICHHGGGRGRTADAARRNAPDANARRVGEGLETAVKKTEKTRTHFTYPIDTWIKPEGKNIVEHVAGVEITSFSGRSSFRSKAG
jgi:hypothetical protein